MPISTYSTTPAANTALFPEGMNPADVNNGMRQVQADIRGFYETPQWRDFGHVPTRQSATTFTVPGDLTAAYVVGMRLRLTDTAAFLYGTITAATYSAPNTTVTVTLDSGAMTSNLTAISLGLDPSNAPIHGAALGNTPVFTNLTVTNNAGIQGALTVTGTDTAAAFIPTSATAPSIGMYRSAANTIGWSTNGIQHMSLDLLGKLTLSGQDGSDQYLALNKPGAGGGVAGVQLQRNGVTQNLTYADGTGMFYNNLVAGQPHSFYINGVLVLQSTTDATTVGSGNNIPVIANNTSKAFVTFTQSGTTITIRNAYNVSSVVRNAAGYYTVNFTNALPNAFYAIYGSAHESGNGRGAAISPTNASGQNSNITLTTTSAQIAVTTFGGGGTGVTDAEYASIVFM